MSSAGRRKLLLVVLVSFAGVAKWFWEESRRRPVDLDGDPYANLPWHPADAGTPVDAGPSPRERASTETVAP